MLSSCTRYLPVAPLGEGGLGAYDKLDDTLIRLQPFAGAKGVAIRLSANGAVFVAERESAR